MRKKIIVFGLCLSLVLTSVTACSKNKSKTKTSEAVSSSTDNGSEEETVSLAQTDLAGKDTEFTTKINYVAEIGDKFVADNKDMLMYFMFSQLSLIDEYDSANKLMEDLKTGLRISNVMSAAFSQLKEQAKVGENEEVFNAYYTEQKKRYEDLATQNSTDFNIMLQSMGYEDEEAFKKAIKSQFDDYVVLAKIAKDNDLTVTKKEYDSLVNAIVASEDSYTSVEDFESKVNKQQLIDSIMMNKSYYQIAKSVTVTEDTETTDSKDDSEALEVSTEIPSIGGDSETLAYSTYDVEVTVPDLSGIKVAASAAKVTKLSLQSAVSAILNSTSFNVENVEKKEGKVEKYDLVNIDYTGRIDGKIFAGGQAEGYNLLIGSNSFIDGFEEGLIGKEVGATEVLNLKFPDDYGQAAGTASQSETTAAEEETTVEETTDAE